MLVKRQAMINCYAKEKFSKRSREQGKNVSRQGARDGTSTSRVFVNKTCNDQTMGKLAQPATMVAQSNKKIGEESSEFTDCKRD